MLSTLLCIKSSLSNRLEWDEYFMSIAVIASCRSPCGRLNVGSVIVKDKHIISMGYNGFIAGAAHISLVLDGHEQATIHSEINAITDCAKRGVCLDNSTIYITHYPCIHCFKCIASCGIKRIIYLEDYNNHPIVEQLAREASIELVKLQP
jgi:dCMP deaminase